eukprot:s13624_g1.t1
MSVSAEEVAKHNKDGDVSQGTRCQFCDVLGWGMQTCSSEDSDCWVIVGAKHNKDGDVSQGTRCQFCDVLGWGMQTCSSEDSDCWVIVGDQVLDVTAFLSEHPGGKKSIMMFAGKDATEEFDMLHDRKVIKKYGLDEGTVVLKGTIKK